MISFFQYVRHQDIENFLALGWEPTRSLSGTHHGDHAILMKWPHDGDPKVPERTEAEEQGA